MKKNSILGLTWILFGIILLSYHVFVGMQSVYCHHASVLTVAKTLYVHKYNIIFSLMVNGIILILSRNSIPDKTYLTLFVMNALLVLFPFVSIVVALIRNMDFYVDRFSLLVLGMLVSMTAKRMISAKSSHHPSKPEYAAAVLLLLFNVYAQSAGIERIIAGAGSLGPDVDHRFDTGETQEKVTECLGRPKFIFALYEKGEKEISVLYVDGKVDRVFFGGGGYLHRSYEDLRQELGNGTIEHWIYSFIPFIQSDRARTVILEDGKVSTLQNGMWSMR